ncbi:MAG: hypothetical protein Q9M19_05495 [Mariprofundaceae bacterium]|nr:hypothetical protein [Mariprofundaceae bacterium]
MNTQPIHLFGLYLIHVIQLDETTIFQALEQQRQAIIPIGRLAIDLRYMNMRSVMGVLSAQAGTDKRFGEVAIELGFLDASLLQQLLDMQAENQPRIGEILVEMGMFTAQERDILLADFHESIASASLPNTEL